MITVLYWVAVIIALTIVQRYFICPILYWIGAILDDFNCSAMWGDKWWFSSLHSKTVKDFISYRKDQTDGYIQYENTRWFPFIGILYELLYLVVILISTIFVWVLIMIRSIIIPIIIFIYNYIIDPIFNFINKIFAKIIKIVHFYVIKDIMNDFYEKVTTKILNIKLND